MTPRTGINDTLNQVSMITRYQYPSTNDTQIPGSK
jgi:hypothetical protein